MGSFVGAGVLDKRPDVIAEVAEGDTDEVLGVELAVDV